MPRLAYLLVPLVLAASGCTLHFSDDTGDDDTCDLAGAEPAPNELRNPQTLTCESFGYGGCEPGCPCPALDVPIPTWGVCGHACETLGETDCVLAAECRAAYDWGCWTNDSICPLETPFLGCYPTDQQGPVGGGGCEGLDSWSCSMHNDCIALHTEQCTPTQCWLEFRECVSEPTPPPCGDCG
jgi:hypothetical protein